jgi:subtilisin family serine protease
MAIIVSIEACTGMLNLSVTLAHLSFTGQRELEEALDYAARRGVIAVAAAGNQAAVGSSAILAIPVSFQSLLMI